MGMGNMDRKKTRFLLPLLPLRAAPRDASISPRQRPDRSRRFHIVAANDQPACGAPGFALVHEADGHLSLAEVPESFRCRRKGCREHWPLHAP